jgi:ABC-2 type transport system permease protein
VFGKDLRVFVRDPSQWSQIFLLLGICAIYLVTAQTLPLDNLPVSAQYWLKQLFSFMNLGMGGFIMAAVAGRFQYPAVSREGRSWWIIRSAPLDPLTWLRAKSLVGFVPMLLVGQVVIVGSGLILDVQTPLLVAEAVTGVFLCFGVSGIAVAMGAIWPDFQADTAARAATSPGAVFFMVVAQVLVFLVLTLEIVGAWLAVLGMVWAAVLIGIVIAGLCAFAGTWPLRRAAAALWAQGL